MNAEVKEKWLTELRSDKYVQGRTNLKRRGDDGIVRHCCLGVLCEIALTEGVISQSDVEVKEGVTSFVKNNTCLPPFAVLRWAGIDQFGTFGGYRGTLVDMNDTGSTFEEIARVIEEKL